ncbi:hypothetical protein D9M72_515920 [compost metagenome]
MVVQRHPKHSIDASFRTFQLFQLFLIHDVFRLFLFAFLKRSNLVLYVRKVQVFLQLPVVLGKIRIKTMVFQENSTVFFRPFQVSILLVADDFPLLAQQFRKIRVFLMPKVRAVRIAYDCLKMAYRSAFQLSRHDKRLDFVYLFLWIRVFF